MSLGSNLLQLILSLIVGIASLLGALFIIGFLLAVPRSEFEDDGHVITQPMQVPPLLNDTTGNNTMGNNTMGNNTMGNDTMNTNDGCAIQSTPALLPFGCTLTGTDTRDFTITACDNTVCDECAEESVTCCCRANNYTSLEFSCEGGNPRTLTQPNQCMCQPCEDITVQLIFQVISSAIGEVPGDAQIIISDNASSSSSSILMADSAGFFSAVREVSVGMVTVTASASGHLDQVFDVTILPPGPHLFIVSLIAVAEETLGSNVNMSLNFNVDEVVNVAIPENSVVTNDTEVFNGGVIVRTNFFSTSQSTYSNDFPLEITTVNGSQQVFYEALVLARIQLVGENETALSIREPFSLSLNFSDFEPETIVSLLLYNETAGIWIVDDEFTAGSRKRQTNGVAMLSDVNAFWAVATTVNPQEICYLQVRTFQRDDALNGATVSLQQFRNALFFQNMGVTGDGSGPMAHSACIEVLCGNVDSGTIEAELDFATITPREPQPDSVTVRGNTITFTSTTEGSPSSPFYNSQEQCSAGNDFVSFEVPLEVLTSDIPPDEVENEFWFIRVEVLGCFDSNLVSTISINPTNNVTSISMMETSATGEVVDIPTAVSPATCTGQVTRRTVCVEAFANSMVTLQVEPHQDNTDVGQLCYLSELTDQSDSVMRNERTAGLDLTTLNTSNPMAGLYFGDIRFLTLDECLNPSSDNLGNTLQGFFAQFECFERPPDSVTVDLPAGCVNESFASQSCSQVPCTTATGDCAAGGCCYREASSSNISIVCPPYNPLILRQPQICSCLPCDDITIDVIVTVTSSTDGSPVMGAMVDYSILDGTPNSIMTDILGMFTITATVSDIAISFNITEANHRPEEHRPVDLIPPGPLRINIVLLSRTITDQGPLSPSSPSIIRVGDIANVTYESVMTTDNQPFMGSIISSASYIAAEMPLSFDTSLPPPVITSGDTFHAVRLIAATTLSDDDSDMMRLTASGVVQTTLTLQGPEDNTFSLLTFDNTLGEWMSASSLMIMPSTPNNEDVIAGAVLQDTELTWAIGNPISSEQICYVQVRAFRRDNNPLSGVEVEVLQFFEQFGATFFFRSTSITGDGSVSTVDHAACLPVLCGQENDGRIRALYHVYLDAYPMQPTGLYPAGQAVNINITNSSTSGPLFPSQAECSMASDGQYVRFDLPIANPPPTDIEAADNDEGFVFLRVSWHECFDYNRVSTISIDSFTNDILAIYSSVVTESGEINDGEIDDMTTSGGLPINCADGAMNNVTARTACIQVEPYSNVTLQVELNPESSLYTMNNELCSLNQTIGSLMDFDASDDRLRFNLGDILTRTVPAMNTTALNDMGIYFDQNSANIAYNQCMNPTDSNAAQLGGSIAMFSCYTS